VGTADFQAMLANLDVCPYRIDIDPRFRLLPSVRVEAGTYRASGNVTAPGGQPRAFNGTFASIGPLVRGQVLIGNIVVLEPEIGLRFPLSRHSFAWRCAPRRDRRWDCAMSWTRSRQTRRYRLRAPSSASDAAQGESREQQHYRAVRPRSEPR
jgi:hypothetical protein